MFNLKTLLPIYLWFNYTLKMINMIKRRAILITFSVATKKFKSNYERNKFFRQLYGWKQTIRKEEKIYTYRRQGILDEVPHIKVDQSMFIITRKHLERIREFLDGWEDKVRWKMFDVILNEEYENLLRGCDG